MMVYLMGGRVCTSRYAAEHCNDINGDPDLTLIFMSEGYAIYVASAVLVINLAFTPLPQPQEPSKPEHYAIGCITA